MTRESNLRGLPRRECCRRVGFRGGCMQLKRQIIGLIAILWAALPPAAESRQPHRVLVREIELLVQERASIGRAVSELRAARRSGQIAEAAKLEDVLFARLRAAGIETLQIGRGAMFA